MPEIKVKCPAKINLTLEVLNKRPDGFHNIESVMQTINLFDILIISVEKSEKTEIKLSGTSDEIPYDERNLVYKAAKEFLTRHQQNYLISIHIEKNIPIAAGLAGGSTDAAGTVFGLNKILNQPLTREQLHEICAKLGSDLNFCLEGGCQFTTGRGEILKKLPFVEFDVSLIKPKNLGISAKEAYTKFSQLKNKPNLKMTEKLITALISGEKDISKYITNDLETAVIDDYEQLKFIKKNVEKSLMSGSGSTFFAVVSEINGFSEAFWIKNGLKSIPYGVNLV